MIHDHELARGCGAIRGLIWASMAPNGPSAAGNPATAVPLRADRLHDAAPAPPLGQDLQPLSRQAARHYRRRQPRGMLNIGGRPSTDGRGSGYADVRHDGAGRKVWTRIANPFVRGPRDAIIQIDAAPSNGPTRSSATPPIPAR